MANDSSIVKDVIFIDSKEITDLYTYHSFQDSIAIEYTGKELDLGKLSNYLKKKYFELERTNYIQLNIKTIEADDDKLSMEFILIENKNINVLVQFRILKIELKTYRINVHCQSLPPYGKPLYRKVFSSDLNNLFSDIWNFSLNLLYNNNLGIPAFIGIAEKSSIDNLDNLEKRLARRFSFNRKSNEYSS